MKRSKLIISVALAGVMSLAVGCGSGSSNNGNKGKAKKDANAIQITGTVKSKNVENISLGMSQDISISVSDVHVKSGQEVRKNDKLVDLDLSDYNSNINKIQNEIDAENIKKDKMPDQDQKDMEQKTIDGYNDEINSIKSKLNKSYISGSSIICDMDDAVVTNVGYSKGDILSPEKNVITVQDLKDLEVMAKVPEENINDIKDGQNVTISTQSYSGKSYKGKVTYVGKSVVSSSSNGSSSSSVSSSSDDDDSYIPVEVSIDDNDGKLLPNSSVDLSISRK
ncbi:MULTISPECIES: efflux RND transporter periplasmic adaptor subunit [Clostridium]|uniref:efflux RND transporter periplasmic adaptor subunit n=1 Tax=Clostridium TaxID=1485 RepID=UPI000826F48B|nr:MULTISPECIES: efflux RND transporter periplasmic adaptor subunit [Clostridium]PJI08245.1 hemolysin D [Clostridium sp. CT7]